MRFNWRLELLILATIGMEATWIFGWQHLVLRLLDPAGRFLAPATIIGLMLCGLYATRFAGPGNAGLGGHPGLVLLIALTTLAAIKWTLYPQIGWLNPRWLSQLVSGLSGLQGAEMPALATVLFAWWRGIRLAQGSVGVLVTGFRFRLGVVLLIWLACLGAFLDFQPSLRLIFTFFGLALGAMALARIEEVSLSGVGQASPFNRAWLSTLLVAVAGTLVMSGVVVQIVSIEAVWQVIGRLDPVWRILDWVLYQILVGVAMLLSPLLDWLIALMRHFLVSWLAQIPIETATPTPTPLPDTPTALPFVLDPVWIERVRWITVGLAMLLLLILISRSIRRARARQPVELPEVRESVWSPEEFANDLAALLRRARNRLRRWPGRLPGGYRTADVRQIYGNLLRLAAAAGYPRPAPDTPYEYLATLTKNIPPHATDMQIITEAYTRVHYGEQPASEQELQVVKTAWERIRRGQWKDA